HLRAALGTFAERLLAGEIHRRSRLAVLLLVVAEIKFDLELGRQLQDGGERESLFAAEALQRTDMFFRDELFDLLNLKHPAAERFPDREVALFIDALEKL